MMVSERRSKTSSIGSRLAVGQTAVASACRKVAFEPRIMCGPFAFQIHLDTECSVSAFAPLKRRLKASLYLHQQSIFHRPHLQY